MKSEESVLMQLGTMILLIVVLPSFSLHLALGLPVVFLAMVVLERHMSEELRNAIKGKLTT